VKARKVEEQARRVRNRAIPEWAEALYFEVSGKNSGVVRFHIRYDQISKGSRRLYRESPE